MANALICDSCEEPIIDMNDRVSILVYTHEPIADPQLDLCGKCSKELRLNNKVKGAQTKAMERIKNWMPPVEQENPTGDPPDSYKPQLGDGNAPSAE